MVIALIGENCSGKPTLAEKRKNTLGAESITGKDYLRMARSEGMAEALFKKKLNSAVSCGGIVYVIADRDLLRLLPDGALRILVSADIDTIKARFASRMNGVLPAPVAAMLERKHGIFDSGEYDFRFDGVNGDADLLCEEIKKRLSSND